LRTFLRLIVVGAFSLVALGAKAETPAATDAAVAQTATFNDALLASMKSKVDREKNLGAAIDKAFNLPVMTQFVVGPTWSKLTPTDKTAVQAALRTYMVVRFASEFDAYNNEKFSVDPAPKVRGVDALVKTTIQAPNETPDKVDYRMRKSGDAWKVIDVYYNGVSDLTTQRADLAATAASGGGAALIAKIEAATKKLR
jgi:phospholipid transport system substrate-binding protein